ncbi:MAG: GNAT family N-acetyltransferase [Caldilineaceae bacterium]|nr:GNAT family N-acetyltransferase [Caldilineaceae bacterium]
MNLSFRPITAEDVRQFFGWRYDPPSDLYTYDEDPSTDDLAYYLDPRHHFYMVVDDTGALMALCSFGEDGRVPGHDYSSDALDIGFALRPDLTGQGRGTEYVRCVIDFASATFVPKALRVTIAAFNQRAQKVWQKLGFVEISRFGRTSDGMPFIVYMKTGL